MLRLLEQPDNFFFTPYGIEVANHFRECLKDFLKVYAGAEIHPLDLKFIINQETGLALESLYLDGAEKLIIQQEGWKDEIAQSTTAT
jgi:hypothetical protein